MHTFRSSIRCAWLAAGLALLSLTASAQVDKPVRLLVGFAPRGSADIAARLLAERLKDDLKQTVTVENKPGAGGRIAAEMLKNAAPDGATVMLAPIVVPVLAPLVFSEVPTFADAGLKGVEGTNWFAVYAPAKTPDATIRQLNAAINIHGLGSPLAHDLLASPQARVYANAPAPSG